MSNQAITWAYRQQLKAGAKFVLVTLADMADQEHSCYPGIEQLAALTGLGRTAVKNAIAALTQAGLLAAQRRHRKDGSRTSNRYYLDVDGALTAAADEAETLGSESDPRTETARAGIRPGLGSESDQPRAGIRPGILEPKVNPQTEPPGEALDAPARETDPEPAAAVELVALPAQPAAEFEEFWAAWPRKDGRKAALAAWGKALRRAPAALVVAAAVEYAASPWRPERQFVPHAATWLNGDRWADPPPQPPEQRHAPPAHHPSVQNMLNLVDQMEAQEAHREPDRDRQALDAGHHA